MQKSLDFGPESHIVIRNDETIISSISVTDIFFDVYLGKWNYRAIPKVKTWSYFLTIPKSHNNDYSMITICSGGCQAYFYGTKRKKERILSLLFF